MPRFKADGSERNARELAEEGCYPLRCTGVEDKQSKKGDAMWSLKWEIVGGPHGGSWVYDIVMFEGKAAGWHEKKLKTVYGDDYAEDKDFATDDMMYREAWGWVVHNTYNGKTNLKIDSEAGGDDCGYAHRSKSPWPDEKDQDHSDRNESGVTDSGEPQDFEDLPF